MTHPHIRPVLLAWTVFLGGCGTTPDGGNDNGAADDMMADQPALDGAADDDTSTPAETLIVGGLTADFIDAVGTALDLFPAGASFVRSNGVDEAVESLDLETKQIASCVVTTTRITDIDAVVDADVEAQPLDAGPAGVIDNGALIAELTRVTEGTYAGSTDLLDRGFAAGDTIEFSFPGGADVEAFRASIRVPPAFEVTTPDLDNLSIDFDAPFDVRWNVAGADRVIISISTTDNTTVVTARCDFEDDGAGTLPREVMACLLEDNTTTTLVMARSNLAEVDVRLTGGNAATVLVTGTSSLSRTLTAPPFGFDPCAFILCPDGQTCNSETFVCE